MQAFPFELLVLGELYCNGNQLHKPHLTNANYQIRTGQKSKSLEKILGGKEILFKSKELSCWGNWETYNWSQKDAEKTKSPDPMKWEDMI